jgi:hypothetical protein
MRCAPRCSAGDSGAVSRTPPSPCHSLPIWIAGKNKGSAAEAITWFTLSVAATLRRCGRCHISTPRPCTQVID